ncbi:hypothetical protein JCM6882_006991 [Rhodosporidiobolus microsporus]
MPLADRKASTSKLPLPSASAPASLTTLPTSLNLGGQLDGGSLAGGEGVEDVEMDEEERARQRELDQEANVVEEENARLRERLLKVEEELEALPDPEEEDDGGDKPTPLEQELAHLEAALMFLTDSPVSPSDPLLTRSPLLADELAFLSMQTTVSELQTALAREEEKRAEEEGRVERDKVWVADAERLEGILEKRARGAREGEGRRDGEVLVLRSQTRLARLTSQFKRLQGALIQFIDERLVEAEMDEGEDDGDAGEDEGGVKKKRKRVRGDEVFNLHRYVQAEGPGKPAEKRAFELKKLIEVLMNRAVSFSASPSSPSSPSSPWTSLSSLTPPPPDELVRFLLRARIARENPRNGGEIRLEDFAEGLGR